MPPQLATPQGLRRKAALALRSRVAGDDAASRAQEIWGKPGPRWFNDQDPIWRVHADASMFVGGIRALLLQSLHPAAMAGVAGHSGFQSDAWGRLQRTSAYIATTTFGTVPDAERAIDRVRGIHRRVRGLDHRGRPYSASDPHLLEWVHLAEVDSFLRAHQRFGPSPLSPAEADLYVAQAGLAASLLGVTSPPVSVAELGARLEAFRPELEGTPDARAVARFLLLTPPLSPAAQAGYTLLAAGAAGLLPWWARLKLRIPLGPVASRALVDTFGQVGTTGIRWLMSGIEPEPG